MRYNINSDGKNFFVNIDSVGFSSNFKTTSFGPGSRNLYIIHYVLSGRGYFNSNEVNEGEGFLIYPETQEHYYPSKENPWSFLWFISRDLSMRKIFEEYHADPDTNIFKYHNKRTLLKLRDEVIENNNKFCRSSEVVEKFLNAFNNTTKAREENKTAAEVYFNYAVNYIDLNLFRAVSVDELTKILGVSQPYLYKVFTDKCGMSPKYYINERKLAEAKRLLVETNMTVSEVANSVGFGECSDFSKFFKSHIGISPTDFRIRLFTDKY